MNKYEEQRAINYVESLGDPTKNENEKSWYQSSGDGPLRLFGKTFVDWLRDVDSDLYGGHDGGLQGGWGGSQSKEVKYGVTMISGILAIGTGGATLALEGVGSLSVLCVAGLVNATDDIVGLTMSDGKTPIQKLLGDNAGNAIKIVGSFVTSKGALVQMVKNIDDVSKTSINMISAVNDQGMVYYGLIQVSDSK